MTPYECVFGEVPDLSHLRIWGCKAYLKLPKNYQRKDWRDKSFAGYFIGYSEPGEMGYKLYIPDLRDTVVGVNCTFNEVIPSYREEYFNELDKLKFEVAPDESTVESFNHLVGENYFDDDTHLEFRTTRVEEYHGLIVAYRAPVLAGGRVGREEKSPIHVADVIRMSQNGPGESPETESNSRLAGKSRVGVVDLNGVRKVHTGHDNPTSGVITVDPNEVHAVHTGSDRIETSVVRNARVRFDVQDSGEIREQVGGAEGEPAGSDRRVETRGIIPRTKIPSRTVTRIQDGTPIEVVTDRHVGQNSLSPPERIQAAPRGRRRTRRVFRKRD